VNRLFHAVDGVWARRTPENESEARRKLQFIDDCLVFSADCCLPEFANALLQQAAVSVKNGITAGAEDFLGRVSELNSIQPCGFRNDVDQDYEVMPITIPTRCRSQIATASEW
jgi:hypothetical protein